MSVEKANVNLAIASVCRHVSIGALLLLASSVLAESRDAPTATASLNLLWSKPIEAQTQTLASSTIVLRDLPRSQSDPIIFLATDRGLPILLEVSRARLGPAKPLAMKTKVALRLARRGDTIWLGGLTNQRAYVPGGDIADPYLGKLDLQGNVIAEYSFRSGKWALIQDLAPLPSGNVIAAGREGETAWVAEISGEGKVLWKRGFGIGQRIGIAPVGDQILAVAFEAVGKWGQSDYREDVRIWKLSRAGKILGSQLIREGINFRSGSNFGRVSLERSNNAAYAVSSFADPSAARAIEITKVSADGDTAWSKTISNTIWQSDSGKSWQSCSEGKTVLANGDLLIACAVEHQILLFQLDANNGEVTERSIPLPECNRDRPAALFLHQGSDGVIWLFGSRPEANVGTGCTWLGELTLKN